MKIQKSNQNKINFKKDCRIINLRKEYPGYIGDENWLLVSSISKDNIMKIYHKEIQPYISFIYMTQETFTPIVKYHSNQRKHEIRLLENADIFSYEDGISESFHPELVFTPFNKPDWTLLYEAIDQLEEKQKERIKKRYFLKFNMSEIAKEEGTSKQAIEKSITRALNSLRKFMNQKSN